MKKVITVSLNGMAYHVEEPGYDSLFRYMERAEARLKTNPDRTDIIRDLEQSIGEKFTGCLCSHKSVISSEEVEEVLKEVGMVDAGEGEPGGESEASGASGRGAKRLYRIREGQKIAGVCTGLAAYADLDVDIVRTIFVLLAIFSVGAFALVYVAMMFLVPVAYTPEQHAEARGAPFHAS